MLDINEVKKDLYKSKNMAKFSHYIAGDLFYTVEITEGTYQFPIATTQEDKDATDRLGRSLLFLSEDLGITAFGVEVKGSELIRWIQKAIKNEQFIRVG